METVLSKKQERFLLDDDKRINLLTGSVRSGKTYVSLLKFILFVAQSDKNSNFLMVGVSLTTLKRNCLDLLLDLAGSTNFWYSLNRKEGRLFGRKIFLEGAGDSTSEQKIRGLTLTGAYCDEVTLYKENFFTMLLSRLSVRGAKVYATCNPDAPSHYIKKRYIDRRNELSCKVWEFKIDDNTFLDPEYVENLKREYTGVFYDRYVLGKWVKAEGLVYQMYDNTVETVDRPYEEYMVSMDYGIQNPTAMILWGRIGDTWYATKEYYYSGREEKVQKTDEQYYHELEKLCDGVNVRTVIIDPSASSFIALIRQKKKFKARHADNAVLEGIQHTASALANKKILFNDCCVRTIDEFDAYSWDEKKENDTPIKENDHAMDAVRYFVQTMRLFKTKKRYLA